MQTISKNSSPDTLEVHQFKSNFFIGNNNTFKLFNPKLYSKSDIKSNNINIIHFEKPPVIIPKSLFFENDTAGFGTRVLAVSHLTNKRSTTS